MPPTPAPIEPDDTPKPNTLQLEAKPGETRKHLVAKVAMLPEPFNTQTTMDFSKAFIGSMDFMESVDQMKEKVSRVKAGDLSDLEATLTAQAVTLNAMFNEMARRAAMNMGEYLPATQTYMQLALKAQTQCRTTIQTLAEIKNPRPVAFVKQANIAHGPQQVNNGTDGGGLPRAHARENTIHQANELLEATHGQRLDIGAPGTASGIDQELAPLGALNGAENIGRKGG